MSFRQNAFATIWSVEPVRDTITKAKITTSKKNKSTGEYETDFSGFVTFLGTATASKAAKLKEKDRIKLGDVDVTRKWDKEKQKEYINFNVFSFEMADSKTASSPPAVTNTEPVDSGEVETDDLPF
ncbi:MAG: hypothetical protein II388_00190 [Clostridia bacterium]|nr:hypothetical protein [Clostridia bacterium]